MRCILVLTIVFNFISLNAGQYDDLDLQPLVSGKNGVGAIASMVDGFIGTNASYCPKLFVTTPEPCHCINIHTVINPPITWMEAAKYCQTKMDNRTILLNLQSETDFESFNEMIGSYAPQMGIANVAVGDYLAENGNVRSVIDQSLANYPNFTGKCKFFVPDDNVIINASCLTSVGAVACQMPCHSFNYPPPANIATGTDRCSKADFNATCQSDWINLGGLCYKNPVDSNTLLSYSAAVSKCEAIGGWLPSFSNQKEWDALTKYVYTVGISGADSFAAPMWLGGTLSGTTATWNDGTPWQFQYWAANEPTTKSSCMWWSVGQGDYWSTGNCTQPAVVFCQQYPQCITTSTSTTSSTKPTTSTSTTATSTSTTTTTKQTSTTTTTTITTGKSSSTRTTLKPSTKKAESTSISSSMPSTSPTKPINLTSTSISSTSTKPVTSAQTQTIATTFRPISDCQWNKFSFTENGVCYEITVGPCPAEAHPGVIRSADVGEKLIKLFRQADDSATSVMFWIGYQNNNASEYNALHNSISTDGSYTLTVDLNNAGQCPTFQWTNSNQYYTKIESSTPCTTANDLYFCETWSTFEQKACNQSLIATGVQNVITAVTSSALECTQQCTKESWCLSVNYNPVDKRCQSLGANLASKSLVCDLGWNYYEKI